MICLGGVYAWSLIASELMSVYNFTATQSQLIFGTIIAIFPTTMIFVGQLARKAGPALGGILFDFSDSFFYAIMLASVMSLVGSLLFLNQFIKSKRNELIKNKS